MSATGSQTDHLAMPFGGPNRGVPLALGQDLLLFGRSPTAPSIRALWAGCRYGFERGHHPFAWLNEPFTAPINREEGIAEAPAGAQATATAPARHIRPCS